MRFVSFLSCTQYDVEMYGYIVKNKDGSYSFTDPIKGDPGTGEVTIDLSLMQDNACGIYHSHGAAGDDPDGAEQFSSVPGGRSATDWGEKGDTDVAEEAKRRMFVITPSDSIKEYNPHTDKTYIIRDGRNGKTQRTEYEWHPPR